MADRELDDAKESPAYATPERVKESPGQAWTLKTAADIDSDHSASSSGASIESFSDISDTGTHFGGAFRPENQLESDVIIGGTYRIIRLIGKGGMGLVYLAEHMTLGKKCALKVMSAHQVTDKAWIRFQTEAKAIAGLDHPNLVRVTNLGVHENSLPFFAMEYVDGQSLAQRLAERGPMDQSTTLAVSEQICNGIECAHKEGIVHRDLKPANIMLVDDNNAPGQCKVKILDFGLAKLSQREGADTNLTATGEIFGSPLYMSPEQCAGERTDTRSDIYSLGCTIFECLTGRPPFTGKMAIPIMNNKIFGEAPTLASASPENVFAASLELIVAKMLKRNPEDRYQTIADLKSDLQSALSSQLLPDSTGAVGQPEQSSADASPAEASRAEASPAESIERPKWRSLFSSPARSSKRFRPAISKLLLYGTMAAIAFVLSLRTLLLSYPANPIASGGLANIFLSFLSPEDLITRIQSALGVLHVSSSPTDGNIYLPVSISPREQNAIIIRDAQERLIAMGERAIPACIKDFGDRTGSWEESGQVLAAIGIAAEEPLLDLLKHQPELASRIRYILAEIGPSTGDGLCRRAISGHDRGERVRALKTLAQLVSAPPVYLPSRPMESDYEPRTFLSESNRTSLLSLLKTVQAPVLRKAIIDTLAYFRSPTPEEVSELCPILEKDPSEIVQQAAAKRLGAMLLGASLASSADILKTLVSALTLPHQAEETRVACLSAMGNAQGTIDSKTLTVIENAVQDQSDKVRQSALQALASLSKKNHECLPYVIMALQEKNSITINAALNAVWMLGPEAKSTLPALIKLANSNAGWEHTQAIIGISKIGVENSSEGVAALLKYLDKPDENESEVNTSAQVISALGYVGDADKKTVLQALQRRIDSKQPYGDFTHTAIETIKGNNRPLYFVRPGPGPKAAKAP